MSALVADSSVCSIGTADTETSQKSRKVGKSGPRRVLQQTSCKSFTSSQSNSLIAFCPLPAKKWSPSSKSSAHMDSQPSKAVCEPVTVQFFKQHWRNLVIDFFQSCTGYTWMSINNTYTSKIPPCSSLLFIFLWFCFNGFYLVAVADAEIWFLIWTIQICVYSVTWTLYTPVMYKHKHEHDKNTSFCLTSVELFNWTSYLKGRWQRTSWHKIAVMERPWL